MGLGVRAGTAAAATSAECAWCICRDEKFGAIACLVVAAEFDLPLFRAKCYDFLSKNTAGWKASSKVYPQVMTKLLAQLPPSDVLHLLGC